MRDLILLQCFVREVVYSRSEMVSVEDFVSSVLGDPEQQSVLDWFRSVEQNYLDEATTGSLAWFDQFDWAKPFVSSTEALAQQAAVPLADSHGPVSPASVSLAFILALSLAWRVQEIDCGPLKILFTPAPPAVVLDAIKGLANHPTLDRLVGPRSERTAVHGMMPSTSTHVHKDR